MAFTYDPTAFLKKAAPGSKIEKALSDRLTLKKSALSNASKFDFLDEDAITKVALKTVKGYRARVKDEDAVASELAADPAQLIQRVQNEVVFQVSQEIRSSYEGEFYIWLPSDAEEPDPEHQLNYGGKFQVGVGEQPGDRYGCRCGMQILTKEEELNL